MTAQCPDCGHELWPEGCPQCHGNGPDESPEYMDRWDAHDRKITPKATGGVVDRVTPPEGEFGCVLELRLSKEGDTDANE